MNLRNENYEIVIEVRKNCIDCAEKIAEDIEYKLWRESLEKL